MIPEIFSEYFKSLDVASRQEIVNDLMLLISTSNVDTASMLARVRDMRSTCCPNCKGNDIRANDKPKAYNVIIVKSAKNILEILQAR